jgi:GAF domain-containing protein
VDDIGEAMAAAARTIDAQHTLQEALHAMVHAASASLPVFEHVGISTTSSDRRITTRAATTQTVWDLDGLQYTIGEGPCVDAILSDGVVTAPSIRHDQRWPRYVPHAVADHNLRAQLAVRLFLDEEGTVGGLNFYSTSHDSFAQEDVDVAELFATHAAIAFGRAREIDNLTVALRSRTVIGQATGLIMAEYGLDQDAAFAFLQRTSSHANRKLREVAGQIVEDADRRARSARGS